MLKVQWLPFVLFGPLCLIFMIAAAVWYPFVWLYVKIDDYGGIMDIRDIWLNQLEDFKIIKDQS